MDTRTLLLMQRTALVEAMSPASEDWAINRAKALLARIDYRLGFDDASLERLRGKFGPNGWAPQVESIVKDLDYRRSREVAGVGRETLQENERFAA